MNITYTFLKVLSRFACILSESGAEKMGQILGNFFLAPCSAEKGKNITGKHTEGGDYKRQGKSRVDI